jgi:hypothetical protein
MVSIGCLHLGKEDPYLYNLFLQYIDKIKPDIVLSGGDLTDAAEFRNSVKVSDVQIKKAIERDKEYTRNFCKNVFQFGNPGIKFLYLIQGNHELRYRRMAESKELFRNELSRETFEKEWVHPEAKIIWDYPEGEILQIGNCKFIHGRWYSKNHLKQHYDAYGSNTFYWHTHHLASNSFTHAKNKSADIVATLGCGEKLLPDWMAGKPHDWVNCFQLWYFDKKGNYQMFNLVYHQDKKIICPDGDILTAR